MKPKYSTREPRPTTEKRRQQRPGYHNSGSVSTTFLPASFTRRGCTREPRVLVGRSVLVVVGLGGGRGQGQGSGVLVFFAFPIRAKGRRDSSFSPKVIFVFLVFDFGFFSLREYYPSVRLPPPLPPEFLPLEDPKGKTPLSHRNPKWRRRYPNTSISVQAEERVLTC